jgi:hypothetical protein
MSTLDGIPLVKRENDISKTCKMLFIISSVIILIICFFYYKKKDIYLQPIFNNVEPIKSVVSNDKTQPMLGKFIQLINLNKKNLPIYKIVIIDKDRNIFPIYTKYAKILNIGKKGSTIQYELPKSIYISQIIIELNTFDARAKNITTTQVRIRDAEFDTVWTNNKSLYIDKYVNVYVANPNLIYPTPQQILNPDLSAYEQEVALGYHLMSNTW